MDTTILTDPFIWVYNDVVPPEKCQEIIDRFNKDDRTYQGITQSGVDLNIKNSKDLLLSVHDDWKDIDKYFSELVSHLYVEYCNHLISYKQYENFNDNPAVSLSPNFVGDVYTDTGYQIQRTEPGKGYVWHHDYSPARIMTFILYLNTVDEGWTKFWNGDQVSPQAGRCVIFPATWTYLHQGYPPKQTKYIMTGWLHENREN